MQIVSGKPPRSRYLERGGAELSREARQRLQWFDHYRAHGGNAALTCRYFGISREAFYRWKRRCDPEDLSTLEDRSHRPHHRRRSTWTAEQAERVRRLREQFPRWGKNKLAVLLRREEWAVSVSMVGRILTSLRQRGALRAPVVFRVRRRRGTAKRPWALRKPKDYAVEKPGDRVQLDTMDLRPAPNVVLKPFTARDVVSRWDGLEVHHRATSTAATLFLDTWQRRLPFPWRAIQVDGGSEFAALFEAACQQRACVDSCCHRARPSSTQDRTLAPIVEGRMRASGRAALHRGRAPLGGALRRALQPGALAQHDWLPDPAGQARRSGAADLCRTRSRAGRGSTAAATPPSGGDTRFLTEATGVDWRMAGYRSKLNRPGETEAGSAGTQPRRGIIRWAHRDDEVGVRELRSTPLPNFFFKPHQSDRPPCLENPRPKGGKI
jgi:hypothetical protein